MGIRHDLPDGVLEWVREVVPGDVTRLERHVARREAWVIDVTDPSSGSVFEGFLRLEREPRDDDPWSLRKETRILQALQPTAVPVPAVHGWNGRLSAALLERVPGRSDLDHLEDPGAQRRVMEHLMQVVAELHNLDPDALGLDDALAPRPRNARECALGELDLLVDRWSDFLAGYREPLLSFGIAWLRRHAPSSVSRVSLVQGDTGPLNLIFDGDRVRALVDWEWGHWGDPMEDLGNICVREFWNPSGGLEGLFRLYEHHAAIPYSPDSVRYYRVQQNVRGMIPIHAITATARPREPVAWFLAYRYTGDRATCEAIAEAMGVALERPELPEDRTGDDILAEAVQHALAHDVAPHLHDPFAASRAHDAALLVACMDRRRRHQGELEAIEREELAALLGRRPRTLARGLAALDAAIRGGRVDDEETLGYLARRAWRDEWLHAPAVSLYPGRAWSPIDP